MCLCLCVQCGAFHARLHHTPSATLSAVSEPFVPVCRVGLYLRDVLCALSRPLLACFWGQERASGGGRERPSYIYVYGWCGVGCMSGVGAGGERDGSREASTPPAHAQDETVHTHTHTHACQQGRRKKTHRAEQGGEGGNGACHAMVDSRGKQRNERAGVGGVGEGRGCTCGWW